MLINLSDEQVKQIYEYDRTRSIVTACNIATTLVEELLDENVKKVIEENVRN